MKVLELFSGTECISNAFRIRGHECFTIDWDEKFPSSLHCDIGTLTKEMVLELFGHPDVIWAAPDCFPSGVLIWTSKGYKNIEDITCNDYVLTHTGCFQRVIKTMRTNKRDLYRVKISGSEDFLVTSKHPFYVRKKNGYSTHENGKPIRKSWLSDPEWKKVEELTKEYRVGIRVNQESVIPKWDGCVYFRYNGCGITSSWVENTLSPFMGNEDFWWFVGRYFGDGYITSPVKKRNAHTIDVCCSNDETEEILLVLNRIGFNYKLRKQGPVSHFAIHNKELWSFLLQFNCGASKKEITPTILNLPTKLLKSFVDGYLSADGHYDSKIKQWKITTVSRNLAYGIVQCVLKSFGTMCSIVARDNNNLIMGRCVNVHRAYQVSFCTEYNPKRSQYLIEDGICWVNIKNIEKQKSQQTTCYNFSVNQDESYTVNNIIVHNCTTYSVAAIGHHRWKNPVNGCLEPKTEYARKCDVVNAHTVELIKQLAPTYWFIENPLAGLRKQLYMQDLPRYTITYCQYGFKYRKATDIWTNHPNPDFLPPCKNGDLCHERAPRGTKQGLQGIKGKSERSKYPPPLCEHIVDICEKIPSYRVGHQFELFK